MAADLNSTDFCLSIRNMKIKAGQLPGLVVFFAQRYTASYLFIF